MVTNDDLCGEEIEKSLEMVHPENVNLNEIVDRFKDTLEEENKWQRSKILYKGFRIYFFYEGIIASQAFFVSDFDLEELSEEGEQEVENVLDSKFLHIFYCETCGSICHFFVKDEENSEVLGTEGNGLTCGVCGDLMIMEEVFLPKNNVENL